MTTESKMDETTTRLTEHDASLPTERLDSWGDQIGRYQIRALLGAGGVGRVFLAHDPELQRPVAIKLLHEHIEGADQLLHEAQMIAQLVHGNVIEVFDAGTHENVPFVVMAYIEGETLDSWHRRTRPSWPETLAMLVQAGRGLCAAHKAGIVHCDFKPSNVMVCAATETESARARVLDFGLARFKREASSSDEEYGLPRGGTLPYMAKELFDGQPGDESTDQFAFCVAAYELLFGVRPYVGETPYGIIQQIIDGKHSSPHNAEVPLRVRSAIVKGLSNKREHRWPSLEILVNELDEVVEAIELRDRVARLLAIGRLAALEDIGPTRALRVPDKLYGREQELAMFDKLFARVQRNHHAVEFLLVGGAPGAGKSALIAEWRELWQARALVLSAKFDQLEHPMPLRSFCDALRGLVELRSRLDSEHLEAVRAGLGRNGQLLIELVPELESIIGAQPPVQPVEGNERLNRFSLLIARFLAALARPSQPLVLILDDLQWIDPASLGLLEFLLTSPESRSLLVIGAYRPREIGPDHRLSATLARLRTERDIDELKVPCLSQASVEQILVETLGRDLEDVRGLARLSIDKTGANPFFLTQFLQSLDAGGLIRHEEGRWSWSLAEIAEQPLPDDVAELLSARIELLPPDSKLQLQLCSCIGSSFELGLLARASGQTVRLTMSLLLPAVEQGLLTTDASLLSKFAELGDEQLAEIPFSFVHDHIQQTAHATLGERERAAAHLGIGRLWEEGRDAAEPGRMFAIADQLNAGRSLIVSPGERRALIELNLSCGVQALGPAASASAALNYLEIASELVSETDHERWFVVHTTLARAYSLDGMSHQVRPLLTKLHDRARTSAEHIEVYRITLEHALLVSDYDAAFAACRLALALLDLELPADEAHAGRELATVGATIASSLAEHGVGILRTAPELDDPRQLELIDWLTRLGVLAYRSSRPMVMSWAVFQLMRLSLEGRSRISGLAAVCYGFLLTVQHRFEEATAISDLGWELIRECDDPSLTGRAAVVRYGLCGHVSRPLRANAKALHDAFPECIAAGELFDASDLLLLGDYLEFAAGVPLDDIAARIEGHLKLLRKSAPVPFASFYEPYLVFLVCWLMDRPTTSLGSDFNVHAFMARFANVTIAQAWYLSGLTKLEILSGVTHAASEFERRVEIVETGLLGQLHIPEVRCYASLGMLRALRERPNAVGAEERERIEASIACWQSELHMLTQRGCSTNFMAKYKLVEAERARLRDAEIDEVIDLYEAAHRAARTSENLCDEALTSQLIADYWTSRGQRAVANAVTQAAIELFGRWGATKIVRQLR